MTKFLDNIKLQIFSYFNLYPAKFTNIKSIQSLIKELRPLSSGKELIRLGPKKDGGYLVPDDLDGIKTCFSAGVGNVSGFEMDCATIGMNVFLADKSVEIPPDSHRNFSFTKKNIGSVADNDTLTLDNWVNSSVSSTEEELLLQIDIEGSEYEVFLSASDELMKRFRIIVVEFHFLGQWFNRPFFTLSSKALQKILETHNCVHIHPNNADGSIKMKNLEIPRTMEFTFLRKDRINNPTFVKTFPHILDRNNTKRPQLILPKCWYT